MSLWSRQFPAPPEELKEALEKHQYRALHRTLPVLHAVSLLNFIIVALCLFLFVVKFIGWIMKMKKKEAEAAPAAPPAPTREEVLLTEIRDLLRARQ